LPQFVLSILYRNTVQLIHENVKLLLDPHVHDLSL